MAAPDLLWPTAGPRSVVVRLHGAVGPDARSAVCAQVRRLLARGDVDVITCDVSSVRPELGAVDALARLQLTARRLGGGIRLRAAPEDVAGLIRLVGVDAVLPVAPDSVESGR
jgi:uncharacterized protein related to proFAR isomerase